MRGMTSKARRAKDLRLQREFHITLEQFDKVLEAQGGACAICKNTHNKKGEPFKLAVDHDHTTGEVRGLVCYLCNKSLAILLDDYKRAYGAYLYLKTPPFEKVFGHKIYTVPGRIGTKVRKKKLAVFNAAREGNGSTQKKKLQTRKSSKK